jgi:hypothetical protein
MEVAIHLEVLLLAFTVAMVLGSVAAKTNFCTMGAVSDWINIGETSRLRSWLLAMAVAVAGVLVLEGASIINLSEPTFPPYRTANFAWARYVLGGLMFGVGMTLASGCGYRTLVRIGGGNLKSVVVLAVAAVAAYLMIWTDFYVLVFGWLAPLTVDLGRLGLKEQSVDSLVGAVLGLGRSGVLHALVGALLALALAGFAFASRDFRRDADNVVSGLTIGLAVVAGWFLTGGTLGASWKDWAAMAEHPPARVEVQSFTFISPMADLAYYLKSPGNLWLINFGIVALLGVIVGSFLYGAVTRRLRLEWFASIQDAANHVLGALLMGIGGVLAMGCTIGQGITGVSTLALGSILATASFVVGAAGTMKFQYWRMVSGASGGAPGGGLAAIRNPGVDPGARTRA